MANRIKKEVDILLDRQRILKYGMQAMFLFEEKKGKGIFEFMSSMIGGVSKEALEQANEDEKMNAIGASVMRRS
jgi:hypothetical protein